jgi:hypothetical protein
MNGRPIVTGNDADRHTSPSTDRSEHESDQNWDGEGSGGSSDADADHDGDRETDLEARVAALEETVADLEAELDQQERAFRLLAGNADIAPVTARCPECETGELRRQSGLSWAKLYCTECGAKWEL